MPVSARYRAFHCHVKGPATRISHMWINLWNPVDSPFTSMCRRCGGNNNFCDSGTAVHG